MMRRLCCALAALTVAVPLALPALLALPAQAVDEPFFGASIPNGAGYADQAYGPVEMTRVFFPGAPGAWDRGKLADSRAVSFVAWWDQLGESGDYRLTDQPSRDAYRQVILGPAAPAPVPVPFPPGG